MFWKEAVDYRKRYSKNNKNEEQEMTREAMKIASQFLIHETAQIPIPITQGLLQLIQTILQQQKPHANIFMMVQDDVITLLLPLYKAYTTAK